MLIIYFFKNLNVSSKKLNFFVKKINGLSIKNMMIYLNFNNKKNSLILKKIFFYIIHNIKNNYIVLIDNLKVNEISVGKGRCLKRVLIKSRGRTNYYYKYFSNLRLVLKYGK